MKPGLPARRAAVRMMTAATEAGETFAQSGPKALDSLDPADRARAQRLAGEALRWANRSDRVLGPYLRNRPYDVLLNAMRLAVWEMLGDGQEAHGVIDSAVEVAKIADTGPGASRLVNAVLRNVDRNRPEWDDLPVPVLPKPLRKRLIAQFGKERTAAIETAHATTPPLDLTPKTGSLDLDGSVALPTGSVRLASGGQVTGLPGYAEGAFWVQDAAAAIPARLLNVQPGERVLDLCAAPGGKTMQLAAAGAEVVALDVSKERLARVKENLARVELTAEMVVADALTYEDAAGFDVILVDAPCSATGTIRRHPELPFLDPIQRLSEVVPLQAKMLTKAATLLRPGGRMVYCTCSLLADEGEAQVTGEVLSKLGLRQASLAGTAPWIENDWLTQAGALRLTPELWAARGGMDGFFIALLEKPA